MILSQDTRYKKPTAPMFRFGVPSDVISDLINIKDKVLMKVYRNLVEFIVMEGVDEYNLAMAMWLVSHCQGHLFVNSPVPGDLKKLVHIANVTEKSKVRDLVASVARHLVKYPTHFVLETTFDTANSLFGSMMLNRHSINRIYAAVKNDYLDRAI